MGFNRSDRKRIERTIMCFFNQVIRDWKQYKHLKDRIASTNTIVVVPQTKGVELLLLLSGHIIRKSELGWIIK